MKKVGSLALALLLSLCCLVGCLAEGSPEKTDYYYIFIPKLVHSWYDAVQAGIATAEEELESTYGVNITVEWLAPSVADGVEQADILESAIAKQPDGIALSVVDQDMVASIIDEALDMGINLITFDTDGSSTNRLAFVGMSSEGNIGEGRSAAEWMAEQMGYEGEVAILAGTPTAQNHKEKVQGFVEGIEQYPDITIVTTQYDNDDLETATQLAENIFAQYPELKGLWGCNGINGIGAGYAFKSAVEAGKFEKGDVCIYGYDTEEEMLSLVREGYVSAFATQTVSDHGYYALKYLFDLSLGNEIPTSHEIPCFIYTRETMDEAPGVSE